MGFELVGVAVVGFCFCFYMMGIFAYYTLFYNELKVFIHVLHFVLSQSDTDGVSCMRNELTTTTANKMM